MAQAQHRWERNRDRDPRAQKPPEHPDPSPWYDRHPQRHPSPPHRSSSPVAPSSSYARAQELQGRQPQEALPDSPRLRPRSPPDTQDDHGRRIYIRGNSALTDDAEHGNGRGKGEGGDGKASSSTTPRRLYAHDNDNSNDNDTYHQRYNHLRRDQSDWRRSPPPRAPSGPASQRQPGASEREANQRDMSTVYPRNEDAQRDRNARSDTSRSIRRSEEANKGGRSRVDRSPPKGPRRQEEPRSSPSAQGASSGRSNDPATQGIAKSSSSVSTRPAESEMRKESRREASRSAAARDKFTAGLVYDEEYTVGESDVLEGRTVSRNEEVRDSVTAKNSTDVHGRSEQRRRDRSRSREGDEYSSVKRDNDSSPPRQRPRYDHRRAPSIQPHRSWRDGQVAGASGPSSGETVRIPTGPKADRAEQGLDRHGSTVYRTDERRVERQNAPPAEAPRGPRYPEEYDRPYDRRHDQRIRLERGWRQDERDRSAESYTPRARVRDRDDRMRTTRRGEASDSGLSRSRITSNGRPPPPPSATADALAYGSVSPEVTPYKDRSRKRSRDTFRESRPAGREGSGDRRRSESLASEKTLGSHEGPSPDDTRRASRNILVSDSKRSEVSDRRSTQDDDQDGQNIRSSPRRERRRRKSPTSHTSPSASGSPSSPFARRLASERANASSSSALFAAAKVYGNEQTDRRRSPAAQTDDPQVRELIRMGPAPVTVSADLALNGGDPVEKLQSCHTTEEEEQESEPEEAKELTSPPRALPSELYTRIAQVGEGTYGQVFKARSERTNVLVALKKIRMEAEKDGFPITAMREIKLLQMLRHRNVVRLHEIMTARGSVYMVFEYMEHDLNGVLNHPNVHFSPAHLKSLASQLLEGLGYLHHKAVLHRDLKGSNVLLNNAGLLKLADFGLARLYARGRTADYTNRVVTLWYRPPELLLGATKYGAEVDMWGAGCIFLELFHRRPIFQGTDEIHQLQVISDLIGPLSGDNWRGVEELPWWELVRPREVDEEGGEEEQEQDKETGEEAMEIEMQRDLSQDDATSKQTRQRKSYFKEKYAKNLSPGALRLAEALLTLDPSQRVTAADALQMDYFVREEPKPRLPHKVLTALQGEWHELESKRARQRAKVQ